MRFGFVSLIADGDSRLVLNETRV